MAPDTDASLRVRTCLVFYMGLWGGRSWLTSGPCGRCRGTDVRCRAWSGCWDCGRTTGCSAPRRDPGIRPTATRLTSHSSLETKADSVSPWGKGRPLPSHLKEGGTPGAGLTCTLRVLPAAFHLSFLASADPAVDLDQLARPVVDTAHLAGALSWAHALLLAVQDQAFGAPAACKRTG